MHNHKSQIKSNHYARRALARPTTPAHVPPTHRLPKGHLRRLPSERDRANLNIDRERPLLVPEVALERLPSSIFARDRPPPRRFLSPRPSSRPCPPRHLDRQPHDSIPERHEARHGHGDERRVAHDRVAPARGAGGGGRCRDQIGPRQGHRRRGALHSAGFFGSRAAFDPRSRPGARWPPWVRLGTARDRTVHAVRLC